MGYAQGASSVGIVDYGSQLMEDGSNVYLWFPGASQANIEVVGYCWLILPDESIPNASYILASGIIRKPGVILTNRIVSSPSSKMARFVAKWNHSGANFGVYW